MLDRTTDQCVSGVMTSEQFRLSAADIRGFDYGRLYIKDPAVNELQSQVSFKDPAVNELQSQVSFKDPAVNELQSQVSFRLFRVMITIRS